MALTRLWTSLVLAIFAIVIVQSRIPGKDPELPDVVKVSTPPSLLNQSEQNVIIRERLQWSLTCEGMGSSTPQNKLKFKWKKDDAYYKRDKRRVFQPDSSGQLTFTQAIKDDAGEWQCEVSNGRGTAVSQVAVVKFGSIGDFPPLSKKEHVGEKGDPLKLDCGDVPESIPPAQIMWIVGAEAGNLETLPDSVREDKRVAYDGKGGLYFSYLIAEDMMGGQSYACTLYSRWLNTLKIGSAHRVRVSNADADINGRRPRIMYKPENVLALRGGNVTLTCIFSGYPAPDVKWRRTSGELPSGRHTVRHFGRQLSLIHVQTDDAGMYECIGANGQGSQAERIVLNVESSPYWVDEPENTVASVGESLSIKCEAAGNPEPSYEFFKNGRALNDKAAGDFDSRIIVQGPKQNELIIADLKRDLDTAVFQCKATNKHGYVWTNFYVNVLAIPPKWMKKPEKVYELINNNNGELHCETFGMPKSKVVWFKDKKKLDDVRDDRLEIMENGNLQINGVSFSDKGDYLCNASNTFGSENSSTKVIVRKKTVFEDVPYKQQAEKGENVEFKCSAKGDPASRIIVSWQKDEKPVSFIGRIKHKSSDPPDPSLSKLMIADVQYEDRGEYTCTVTTYSDGSVQSVDTVLDVANATAKLSVLGPPDPPTDVNLKGCLDHTADITWEPGSDNDSPIKNFMIQHNTAWEMDSWIDVTTKVPSDAREFRVDLSPWAQYTFRIIARNEIGNSEPSDVTDICATPAARPSKNPDNVRGNGTSPNNLVISWDEMEMLEQNGPGFFYQVEYKPQGAGEDEWVTVNITDPKNTSITVQPTDTYQPYDIRVEAHNDMGSAIVPAVEMVGYSGEDKPDVIPQEFQVARVLGPREAEFAWKKVENDVSKIKGAFVGYKIRTWTKEEGKEKARVTLIKPDQTTAKVENLKPFSEVHAEIVVYNGVYEGEPSEHVTFQTPEGAPGPVNGLQAYPIGSNAMFLEWQKPLEPNGNLTGYVIVYRTTNGTKLGDEITVSPPIVDGEQTNKRIRNLQADTMYRIMIRAQTKAGPGEATYVERQTGKPGMPLKPVLIAEGHNDTTILLRWEQPDDGIQGKLYYANYRKVGDEDWGRSGEEYVNDYIVIDSLEPGTKYEVQVVAVNDEQEAPSDIQVVTTKGDDFTTAGWFIGMMIAIVILILILIIICLIRRNRGGKYPVQEKEAALGKDPEKADEDGGFPEYSKPVTDTPEQGGKGSQPSLNSDMKPMESDTDSMAEYGDGEGGKFNEDGSFIGQYGADQKKKLVDAEQPSALSTFV